MSAITILMVRPVAFSFNQQTAESNAFQQAGADQQLVQQKALAEFDAMVSLLHKNGVDVIVVDDTPEPHTPDSIFPNNWVSFHEDGRVFLYPMQAENRRLERRMDIIETLARKFTINQVDDLSYFESEQKYLEGTGSMVLDRQSKIAYACLSPRTDADVIAAFCRLSGYSAHTFHAFDGHGQAIYHTNVMMCVGESFVVICLDSVAYDDEMERLIDSFDNTGKQVINISLSQMNAFAGNMLEVVNQDGEHLLVMSESAYQSLSTGQLDSLEQYCRLIYTDLQTIEKNGGGSARCMMAEIDLPPGNEIGRKINRMP